MFLKDGIIHSLISDLALKSYGTLYHSFNSDLDNDLS